MVKKILLVIPHLKVGGGAERIATELAKNIDKKKFEVIPLTFYDLKPKYFNFKNEISFKEKPSSFFFTKIIKLFIRSYKIKKFCEQKDIGVVISFLEIANFSSILSKLLFFNKSKIIISERNNPLASNYIYKKLSKLLYPKADMVVALSKGVENVLKSYFKVKKSSTIYNMQDVDSFKSLGNKKIKNEKHLNIMKDGFLFVNVARLSSQKAQKNLIKSFKLVIQEFSKAKLLIFGSGELELELKKLVKQLKLTKNVFFMGVVKNIHPYLKKSNCFVLTSDFEGFGNVLTEALTHNLPVISTDCNYGPREILCPELEIGEKISYPYKGSYGTLVQTFNDSTSLKNIAVSRYSDQEITLSKVLLNHIFIKSKVQTFKRAEDFSKSKIIKEWDKVISKY